MGTDAEASSSILSPQLQAFKGLACTARYAEDAYRHPTHDNVDAFIKAMDWSQNDVARLVGVVSDPVKGSITVRRWRLGPGSAHSRVIPYAAWRLMLLAGGVVDRP